MPKTPAGADPEPAITAAINLLVTRGYDATSVDDLADAAGVSRSTFFRRFGSKEDVVFADHDLILARVEDYLRHSTTAPLEAVAGAAAQVFAHHVEHRETSVTRHQLLQQVPSLRDRELVTSHRYERAFRSYLEAADARPTGGGYLSVAAAAAVVAVHNAFLRRWFRDPESALQDQLEAELRALTAVFQPAFDRPSAPEAPSRAPTPAVMVTVFPAGTGKEQILRAVEAALPTF